MILETVLQICKSGYPMTLWVIILLTKFHGWGGGGHPYADPESFVRGGPTLPMVFFFVFFF